MTRLPYALATIAIVLSCVGAFFTLQAPGRAQETAARAAAEESAVSAELRERVSTTLERIFSLSYDHAAATVQAADEVLIGAAVDQYAAMLEPVRAVAARQRLVVRAHVVDAGIKRVDGDRASLLVLIEQSATRGDTNARSADTAQVRVSVKRVNGSWKISALAPL